MLGVGAREGRESEAVLHLSISGSGGARDYGRKKQGRFEDTFGSCMSSFSQCSAVLIDRVGSHAVEGNSLYDSGVRGVSISLLT